MTSAYCTYFDSTYLSRGRVLLESLRRQGDGTPLYVLALDGPAFQAVSEWVDDNVTAIQLVDLEVEFPELVLARESRSRMEYVFTLTPFLTRWVAGRIPQDAWVTYLDADMAFYSTTEPLYEEILDGSVAIVEHRFTREQRWRLKYGRFNVAWVGFRNDAAGRACLDWWCARCLEWCKDEVSKGRFADQGYLDQFPALFERVVVIANPGADVAPWNLRKHEIKQDSSGAVTVDGSPLVFFHFHGLKKVGRRYYFKHLPYFAKTTRPIREGIYLPYCRALDEVAGEPRDPHAAMARRPTFLSPLKSGRSGILRWLGERRGDFLDVSVDTSGH